MDFFPAFSADGSFRTFGTDGNFPLEGAEDDAAGGLAGTGSMTTTAGEVALLGLSLVFVSTFLLAPR